MQIVFFNQPFYFALHFLFSCILFLYCNIRKVFKQTYLHTAKCQTKTQTHTYCDAMVFRRLRYSTTRSSSTKAAPSTTPNTYAIAAQRQVNYLNYYHDFLPFRQKFCVSFVCIAFTHVIHTKTQIAHSTVVLLSIYCSTQPVFISFSPKKNSFDNFIFNLHFDIHFVGIVLHFDEST